MPIAAKVPKIVAIIAEDNATIALYKRDIHKSPEFRNNSSYHLKENPVKFAPSDLLNEKTMITKSGIYKNKNVKHNVKFEKEKVCALFFQLRFA